jgi:hypothetical protein
MLAWGAALFAVAVALAAPTRVPITTNSFGAWEGFGTSLAWWANVWGSSPALADLAFSCKEAVAVPGIATPLPGLCFTIARYNVGGSSNASAGGERIVYSPNIPYWKQIQGYWLDWASDDPGSSSWDWSVDANQRQMLLAAQARGADTFELFSNSPMWWMLCVFKQPPRAHARAQTSALSYPARTHEDLLVSHPRLPLPRHHRHQFPFAGTTTTPRGPTTARATTCRRGT